MEIDPLAQDQLTVLSKSTAYNKIKLIPRIILFTSLTALFILGLLWPYSVGALMLGIAFTNYLLLLSFRLANIEKPVKSVLSAKQKEVHHDLSLTILLPLKNEGEVIRQTIQAIDNQDYPKELCELIIIVENSDLYTQSVLSAIALPKTAKILLIPSLNPFTKGRALLHGLQAAKNTIITVFDAESQPEPDQFSKALSILHHDPDKYCIQSKVRISNKDQNWITRNFATEYFEWFDQFLQEQSNIGKVFGLGGNSFYISRSNLLKSGSWDPFNVTEDAELSVRLIQHGVELKLIDSYTFESCPSTMDNWLLQRVRWNKGLLITQLVHLIPTFGTNGFNLSQWFSFWTRMLAGTALPFFNLYVLSYFIYTWFSPRVSLYADLAMWTLMVVSIGFMVLLNSISFKRLKISRNPLPLIFGGIGYIALHISAGYMAYYEYFVKPLKWNNTRH